MKSGGSKPPHFQKYIIIILLIYLKKPQNYCQKASEALSGDYKFHIFQRDMPPDPLDGWWFSSLKPEPPHFCRAFYALVFAKQLTYSICTCSNTVCMRASGACKHGGMHVDQDRCSNNTLYNRVYMSMYSNGSITYTLIAGKAQVFVLNLCIMSCVHETASSKLHELFTKKTASQMFMLIFQYYSWHWIMYTVGRKTLIYQWIK